MKNRNNGNHHLLYFAGGYIVWNNRVIARPPCKKIKSIKIKNNTLYINHYKFLKTKEKWVRVLFI